MENKETTKYYWLKMERGFFKRHDITIIENYGGGYPDGQLMVNLYMRLLVESIDHNGNLRFSDEKPYNNMMLSAITGLDIKIVEKGMECFKEFDLIRVLSDGTIFMTKVEKMFGAGSSTERVKKWRERQKDGEHENVEPQQPIVKKPTKPLKEPTLKNDELFNQFWEAYPRKVGKDKCQNWFKIRKITQEFVDDLVLAIEQQKKSVDWLKKDNQGHVGGYIPHPYTWLNRGGWNDELTYAQPIENKIKSRWENFINGEEK